MVSGVQNPYLIAGAVANGMAALLHVGCIVFGASWYRFFGAGEQMAQWAEAGSRRPAIITSFIVAVLLCWMLYALSGAGLIWQLPLLRPALAVITGIYLLRAAAGIPLAFVDRERSKAFWLWSSLVCLGFGMLHFAGYRQLA